MSKPLAVGVFDHRSRTAPLHPEYVMLRVEQGQENLHIDGEYAIYRCTDGPEVAEMVWSLFGDWENGEDALFAEFGVGQLERHQLDGEIAERRRQFEAVFGPEPTEATS